MWGDILYRSVLISNFQIIGTYDIILHVDSLM